MTSVPNESDIKQLKYDQYYMDMATIAAEMSYAERKKVGAIAVKDGKMIADGWNGMPGGMPNKCERMACDGVLTYSKTLPEVLHAELNLIGKLAQSTESSKDATLYCTLMPCIECAKLIHRSGFVRVVYKETYRDLSGIKFLIDRGILTEEIKS